jgi:hypothetical protein
MTPDNWPCDSTVQGRTNLKSPSIELYAPNDLSVRLSPGPDFRVGQDTPSQAPIQESFREFLGCPVGGFPPFELISQHETPALDAIS